MSDLERQAKEIVTFIDSKYPLPLNVVEDAQEHAEDVLRSARVGPAMVDGLPPGPPDVDFDTAVNEVMDHSLNVDKYGYEQVPLRSEALQVLAFVIRWLLEEDTGAAPNLYDRMKNDFQTWQNMRDLAEGGR